MAVAPTNLASPDTTSADKYVKGSGPHWTADKRQAIPPKYASVGIASEGECPATTMAAVFQEAVRRRGEKVALRHESGLPPFDSSTKTAPPALPLNEWTKITYREYYEQSCVVGRAMMALGLKRFDGVNIYGFNSPEWFMAEIGAIFAGGIAAGIYPSDTPDQVEYKSLHSGASIAVVDNVSKAKVFLNAAERLPQLKAVVVWDPDCQEQLGDHKVSDARTIRLVKWSELQSIADSSSTSAGASDGSTSSTHDQQALEARMASQQPGHACAYIYTSGTTGRPKAVMISHDNILFECQNVLRLMPNGKAEEEERVLSFLPLSHVAGMMVDIVAPVAMAAGSEGPGWTCVCFARTYDLKAGTLGDRLRTVRPTMFLGVPRVWEKIAEKMKAVGARTKGLKKALAGWAKAKGLARQRNQQLGGTGRKPALYGVAEALVLSKVKAALGLDRCKFGFTGAAPITTDTLEYFGSLGIQINEVYGMSECTGATTWSTDGAHAWGSCGWAMPGVEVRVCKPKAKPTRTPKGSGEDAAEDGEEFEDCPRAPQLEGAIAEEHQGEICFRGRHIMLGYMANPELGAEHVAEIERKNAEAIDADGWLHSGDKGCMDARGMVRITGRYKELIISAGGENIAPVPIEDSIKRLCAGVSNVLMVGDRRKFNVAVLTLKAEGAEGEEPGTDNLAGAALDLHKGDGSTGNSSSSSSSSSGGNGGDGGGGGGGGGCTTISAAMADARVIAAIQEAIDRTNADERCCTNNASRIQKWTILPRDFSVREGELTPTLKTKRAEVHRKYAAAIEGMYASREKYVPYYSVVVPPEAAGSKAASGAAAVQPAQEVSNSA